MTRLKSGAATVGLIILALSLAGCASSGSTKDAAETKTAGGAAASVSLGALAKNGDGYVDLSVDQLAGSLPDKRFTLVNVHVPYEGELSQTDLFIPYDQIEQHLDELPDKNAPIVLYCRSGRMSTDAAQVLVRLGYTSVMELDGGMSAWESAGHELQLER